MQDWTGQLSYIKWQRSLKLDVASPDWALMRKWLKSARHVCASSAVKDVSKLRANDLMQEIASMLTAAGVSDSITTQ